MTPAELFAQIPREGKTLIDSATLRDGRGVPYPVILYEDRFETLGDDGESVTELRLKTENTDVVVDSRWGRA